MSDPIQVLLLAADPRDASAGLHIDHEIRRSLESVRMGQAADQLRISAELAVRREDLVPALLRNRPQIVHFAGHGNGEGLILENYDSVLPESLAKLFTTFREVRAVVLNACKSLVVAEALTKVVDYTVAMEAPIGDETAVEFAGAFYAALAFGSTVPFAFDAACAALSPGPGETDPLPRLLVRPGAAEWPVQLASAPPVPKPEPRKQEIDLANVTAKGPASLQNRAQGEAAAGVSQSARLNGVTVDGALNVGNDLS